MNFDRLQCGNGSGDGILYEVFDPPWWRIDRWFDWWFKQRSVARGLLTIFVSGKSKEVRCRAIVRPRQTLIFPSNPLN